VNARPRFAAIGLVAAILVLTSACASGGGSSAPSVAASASSSVASAGASSSAGASPTAGPVGEATLDAPAEVAAGAKFDVSWTGPKGLQDYVTIVAAGATKWTNEPYFYTTGSSPGSLVAPVKDGAYALWYVSGATDTVLARRAIRVTPFVGALGGPAEVMAGSSFEVAWNGPNGPQDYVTIVAVGTAKWTNESYFYTANGTPGKLVAPLEPGSYQLWYVTGADDSTQATAPITVTPYAVTLDAPAQVAKGATFQVAWTGPNGPQDYVTIVAAGSAAGTYASYAYVVNGSPVTLTAPPTAGNYEIRYQSDRIKNVVFGTRAITVH
jgi:Ca-activated chloride channel family protein